MQALIDMRIFFKEQVFSLRDFVHEIRQKNIKSRFDIYDLILRYSMIHLITMDYYISTNRCRVNVFLFHNHQITTIISAINVDMVHPGVILKGSQWAFSVHLDEKNEMNDENIKNKGSVLFSPLCCITRRPELYSKDIERSVTVWTGQLTKMIGNVI